MNYFRVAWHVLIKDLRVEARSREALATTLVFAALVLTIFRFAFEDALAVRKLDVLVGGVAQEQVFGGPETLIAGMVWVAIAFAGMLGFGRCFGSEKDDRSLDGLLLLPGDRSAVLVGKILFNMVLLFAVEALVLPLAGLFFTPPEWGRTIVMLTPILFLGTLGYAVAGTLFAAVTSNTRLRDLLLPILLLPVVLPVLIGSVEATSAAVVAVNTDSVIAQRESLAAMQSWIRLLVACDVIYIAAALWLFEPVVEE